MLVLCILNRDISLSHSVLVNTYERQSTKSYRNKYFEFLI